MSQDSRSELVEQPGGSRIAALRARSRRLLIDATMAGVIGLVCYAASTLCVISNAPRYQEGIRSCVDLPWPLYATLPLPIAVAAVYGVTLLVSRDGRRRIYLTGMAGLAIFICSPLFIGLLRRDFIGKF